MTDAIDRPAPYRIADRREWLVCDESPDEGFAILVRTSITNADQRALQDEHLAIAGTYTESWMALPADERDLAVSPRAKELDLLARYVLDWNAEGLTETEEWAPLPPPVTAGGEVFGAITPSQLDWITRVVLVGYTATGKAGGSLTKSGSAGDGSGPRRVPDAA